jgi:hypothetical protein
VEIGKKAGGAINLMAAYADLGRAYLHAGSYAEAVVSSNRCLSIARESHGALEMEPYAAAALAEAYAYTGDADRALRTAEEQWPGPGSTPLGWSRTRSSPWPGFSYGRKASRPATRSRRSSRGCPDSRARWE